MSTPRGLSLAIALIVSAFRLAAQEAPGAHPVWNGSYTPQTGTSLYARLSTGLSRAFILPSGYREGELFSVEGRVLPLIGIGMDYGVVSGLFRAGAGWNVGVAAKRDTETTPPSLIDFGGLVAFRLPWYIPVGSGSLVQYAGARVGLSLVRGTGFLESRPHLQVGLVWEAQIGRLLQLRILGDFLGMDYDYEANDGWQLVKPPLSVSMNFGFGLDFSGGQTRDRLVTARNLDMFGGRQ